jgi:protein-S-isoprenylcysteine O-methyltransferase Ste14
MMNGALARIATVPVLAGAALGLHALAWGAAAPLGRAPLMGALLLGAGLAWLAWAAWALRRAGNPVLTDAPPRRLVDDGPYRFGRHPMALGTVAALLGAALAFGSPLLTLAAAGYAAALQFRLLPREEAALARAFGGWYADYRQTVRRWL